ncbi:AI-2E family transporter [Propionimicrobium lymphophilum]|uniref:AI-2E family transporter n=1 Tax=Propionimicrobium lymphophilum ACS-093-V-SCH5 TaxID=883161 RepID=S2WZN1_9ACTN|nr:AI-2E family transporter [Propionimicrobium lymphophilum]EPD33164.1 hypothetical protein HMPREF9306_00695 [Propionimicrobium lymphophilum ACS-093-V-SCH5]MDK7709949.1 AI-2E family transporter [Propionimicrobium lymphophilum]MDK7732802.1 AI-2E family transporter [Propionimicrobium lymphophilum]
MDSKLDTYTPKALKVGAAWSWRFLAIAGAVAVLWWLGSYLSVVVVPVILAVMVTAGLAPLQRTFIKWRWPSWLAALTPMLIIFLIFCGLVTLVGAQIAGQWRMLVDQAVLGFGGVVKWLGDGPLHVSQDQINDLLNQAIHAANNSRQQIASAAASAGSSVGKFFAGAATCVFATFFFMKDGRRFMNKAAHRLPVYAQKSFVPAVRNGWKSLVVYMRAAVIVAGIDGVGAGIGALVLGSNMWLAILVLTFICSFVPLVGAFVAGTIATVVVLVTLGFWKAVIMLVVFVAVMSIESHVLQPMILGRAAEIHPLLVLLGIAVGSILAGIAGALFAIPIVAFLSGMIRHLVELSDAKRRSLATAQ